MTALRYILILLLMVSGLLGQVQDTTLSKPGESNERKKVNLSVPETTGIKTLFAADSNGAFSPKKAMVFSAITPGLGHVYVRKPLKGLIYFTAEAYHIQRAWHFNNLAQYVEDTKDKVGRENWLSMNRQEKNQAVIDSTGQDIGMNYWRPKEKRNKRIWWSVGIYVMTMLDAYVDAHLSDFPEGDLEFINDTAIKSRGIQFSIPIKGIKK